MFSICKARRARQQKTLSYFGKFVNQNKNKNGMKSTYIFIAFPQMMIYLSEISLSTIRICLLLDCTYICNIIKIIFFFTGKVVVIRKQVNFLLILTLAHATSEWDEPFLPFSRRTLQ